MKIYSAETVYQAALDRIRWLFQEFPNVIVSYSGGKDSTICFQLSLQVARELGRLPLKVMFIDQEAEWQATVDMVAQVMYDPEVEPYWYQMPIRLFNATSAHEHWLNCWDPARREDWIHPQQPIAITKNVYGTDRFHNIYAAILKQEYPNTKTCYIAGVRAEENPTRLVVLTTDATYKWATWGKVLDRRREHYTMYPIYDWSYTDVWKAIHDNGWPYNRLYDYLYQYGTPVLAMRVSNVHHETAVKSLFMLQEIEPEVWERLTVRLAGVDMASKMGAEDYFPTELPYMFASWREYRDYLLEKLIDSEDWRGRLARKFAYFDRLKADGRLAASEVQTMKACIKAILVNDWELTTLVNFAVANKLGKAEKADRMSRGVTSAAINRRAARA